MTLAGDTDFKRLWLITCLFRFSRAIFDENDESIVRQWGESVFQYCLSCGGGELSNHMRFDSLGPRFR
jgi:hypothetical protein